MLKYEKIDWKGRSPLRKIYNIEKHVDIHNKVTFIVNENDRDLQIIPTGRLFVDSDHFAFLYIVEENGEFSYLRFGEGVWPALVEVVRHGKEPLLSLGDRTLELDGFHEELESLLYNIEGNINYGEEFVARVEAAFQAILANDEV